ncbi:MAG: hypothetical protein JSU00_14755 [Acidobacteria bacterium]|nr:hypothetical protein [Acidobacteriota bacterium]
MTVSSLSSSLYIGNQYSTSQIRRASSAAVQDASDQNGASGVSKLGSYMKQLEELQSSDPTKFKEVTAEIAQKLKDAAQTATDNGDDGQAEALSDLADQFTTASENGSMPDLRPKDGARAQGPMGPPPPPPPDASSASSSSSSSATTDSDSDASSDITTSAGVAKYTEMLKLFASMSSDSNPMNTLEDILGNVFSSSSSGSSSSVASS